MNTLHQNIHEEEFALPATYLILTFDSKVIIVIWNISIVILIAQLVERPLLEREVLGSNPVAAPYQRCKNGTSSSLADARI